MQSLVLNLNIPMILRIISNTYNSAKWLIIYFFHSVQTCLLCLLARSCTFSTVISIDLLVDHTSAASNTNARAQTRRHGHTHRYRFLFAGMWVLAYLFPLGNQYKIRGWTCSVMSSVRQWLDINQQITICISSTVLQCSENTRTKMKSEVNCI